jgi:hypothetical protein
LNGAEVNKKALEDQLKNTKEKGEIEVVKSKIETITKEVEEIKAVVTTYSATVKTLVTEVEDLESGKAVSTREEEVKLSEEEAAKLCGEASKSITKLPLMKEETIEGKSDVVGPSPAPSHPGVISGVIIKGDIGGTSTTTTGGQTDISTQIIEK